MLEINISCFYVEGDRSRVPRAPTEFAFHHTFEHSRRTILAGGHPRPLKIRISPHVSALDAHRCFYTYISTPVSLHLQNPHLQNLPFNTYISTPAKPTSAKPTCYVVVYDV